MEELLSKYFSGEATTTERQEVEAWRNASSENAREYLEIRATWLSSGGEHQPNAAVLASILDENEAGRLEVVPLWSQRPFQIAAAVILLVVSAFVVIELTQSPPPYGEVVTEVSTFDLPDGSQVTLQRGASIQADEFDEVRTVYLTGKAFFEVERDESRPFIVVTKSATVKVLGTSFMVNAEDESGATTEVMVASGEVSLGQNPEAFNGKSMKINLKQGEMGKLTIGARGIKKKKISDENYLAWKTKVITFKSTRLAAVADQLNDVYGINLDFENRGLESCKLTAKFNEKTPDELIDIIAQTFGLTYARNGETYVLAGEGCGN